jgi:ribonuclease Y
VYELGISGLHERLVLLLGRLSFFTVDGQNLLQRSQEVSQLCGVLGHELLAGGEELRRAGLLHEIARADKDSISSHPAVASADIASRFGEPPSVTNPIRALAQPADAPRTPEGVLLVTARRFVLSRPGARRDNLQRHIDRQRQVEELALGRDGIDRAVAVRAGRELRVHVAGEVIDDEKALLLARALAREIEEKVDYPGQIRVLVIRETRAVSYAV